jgi:hypothetical protein
MYLTQRAYQQARLFVQEFGRPLENARLRVHFDGAPAQTVIAELEKFQNPDGGFGRGLEPDLRIQESSALGTETAFQIWREVKSPQPVGRLAAAIPYLLQTLDSRCLSWRMVPKITRPIPQAAWWNEEGRQERVSYQLNPTAQLVGTLYDFRQEVSQDLLSALTNQVIHTLNESQEMIMHDFLCCKYLAETENLDPIIRKSLLYHLKRLLETAVNRNPDDWRHYSLRPVQVVENPLSEFYHDLADILPQNLDFEIANQQEDGSWAPNWEWDADYAQEWAKARLEWAGVLTVERLLVLRNFKRIEGIR